MKFNWSFRKLALAALLCMIIGIIGIVILIRPAANGSTASPINLEQTFDAAAIASISVTTDVIDVEFVKGTGNEVKLKLAGSLTEKEMKELSFDAGIAGDSSLNVEVRVQRSFNVGIDVNQLLSLFQNGLSSGAKLEVVLPEKLYRSINLKTNTGDGRFHPLKAEQLSASTDTGDITLGGFEGGLLRVDTDTGDLRLQHVKAEIDLDTATGDVVLGLDELSKSVGISTDTGDVKITLSRPAPLRLDFSSDTGRTTASIPGEIIQFDVKEKHRLKGSFGGTAGPMVKVNSDTGDIGFEVK